MLAGAAMALSAAAADRPNDVVRTWETAFVAVQIETPDLKRIELGGRIGADYIAEILQGMSPTLKQPVVIFISDCNYRSNDPEARQQIKFIASLGYIVFAPNSFARIGREPACDVVARRFLDGTDFTTLHELRREEAAYAIERVLALPWVDPDRIFLIGAGDGADAVLNFSHEAITGRIAISPSCMFDMTAAPAIPTLIVRADRDVWYSHEHWPGAAEACTQKLKNDPTIEIASIDGTLHDPLIYPEGRARFWNFMVRAAFF